MATTEIDTLRDLVTDTRFTMITTVEETGKLASRPMTVNHLTDDWVFLFVVPAGEDTARQADNAQVNLAFITGKDDYASISGKGRVVNDVETKKELWNVFTDAYAGEAGPEDPSFVVLAVAAESGQYWQTGNSVATLVGVLRSQVTGGERPQRGESGTVEL